MKNSKRIISVVLSIVLLMMGLTSTSYADVENETEIIFKSDSVFTEDQKDIIRTFFEDDQQSSSAYGLKCTLFGHSYVTEYVTVIQHRYNSTSPRCREEYYKTNICEDCSDTQATLIAWQYIECCE